MPTPNKTILEKADLAVSDLTTDGGALLPSQFKEFLRRQIERAKLSGMITRRPLNSPTQELDSVWFGGQVLYPKTDGVALPSAQRSKPNLAKETWNAQEFGAEVRLPRGVLEDNVEGQGFEQTIRAQLMPAIGRDMEKVMIQGDTTSADPLLSQLDGLIVQATSHAISASGVRLTRSVLKAAVRAMPEDFDEVGDQAFFTSKPAQHDYSDSLASRATNLGDREIAEERTPTYKGDKIHRFPLWPKTLGVGSDETVVIHTHPKNMMQGIWRRILLETDKDISAGVLIIVATLRFDVRYQVEDAVVKTTEVLNS
jgi:hypothetical protein